MTFTSPLRLLGTSCRRLLSAIRDGRVASGIKRRTKSVFRICAFAVLRHPMLKRGVLACLRLVPPLDRRLRAVLTARAQQTLSEMSPATRAVYLGLKAARERD